MGFDRQAPAHFRALCKEFSEGMHAPYLERGFEVSAADYKGASALAVIFPQLGRQHLRDFVARCQRDFVAAVVSVIELPQVSTAAGDASEGVLVVIRGEDISAVVPQQAPPPVEYVRLPGGEYEE